MAKNPSMFVLVVIIAVVFAAAAGWANAGGLSAAECRLERRVGINACKSVLYGSPPSPMCCRRLRITHLQCICPDVTPKLAALIDINRAIRIVEGCGRRLPHHYKCGMEYFSEMESSTKMPDPKKVDPKKIQELVGIKSKKPVSVSIVSGGKKTPARAPTPASTSNILRDQPDDALVEKQLGEGADSRKRLKTTDTRHGIGKEARKIPHPKTIDPIPETTTSELEMMAPDDLNQYISKLLRAVRLSTDVATNRIGSPSSALAEKEETIEKQKSKIENLEARARKLDGRRLTLEADLEVSRFNLSKAEKVLADREAELTRVKSELETVKAELAGCIKARDDLQIEVDSLASRMEMAKKDFLASDELRTEIMLLMTQAMKGGFTNALKDVKEVFPEFEVSSIKRAHLYDEESIPRYGRYFEEFRSGVSLHEKYVRPALVQEGEEDDDVDVDLDDVDLDASRLNPPDA